jgi:hypothetical protein
MTPDSAVSLAVSLMSRAALAAMLGQNAAAERLRAAARALARIGG